MLVADRQGGQQLKSKARLAVPWHASDRDEFAAPQTEMRVEIDEPSLVRDGLFDIWVIGEFVEPLDRIGLGGPQSGTNSRCTSQAQDIVQILAAIRISHPGAARGTESTSHLGVELLAGRVSVAGKYDLADVLQQRPKIADEVEIGTGTIGHGDGPRKACLNSSQGIELALVDNERLARKRCVSQAIFIPE